MKLKGSDDLISILVLSALLIILTLFFDIDALRIILGLPFILFFPGYTIVAALFQRKRSLGGIERVALSFGMSICVTSLIGLMLNYTPWGISLITILVALTVFIFAMSLVVLFGRQRLPKEERFEVKFSLNFLRRTKN